MNRRVVYNDDDWPSRQNQKRQQKYDNPVPRHDPEQYREAEQSMMEGFYSMMSRYHDQQKQLKNRKAWVNNDRAWSGPFRDTPPSEMTVTHINQTKDLHDGTSLESAFSQFQTSAEWLTTHNLKALKLTLKDLVNRGKLLRSTLNKDTGKVQQRLSFEASDIASFELRIHGAIQTYSKRIKWLLQGSRKMFGTVHGRNVAVFVDSSEACLGFGRRTPYIQALTQLLEEQLSIKKGLYLASFGSDVYPLWAIDSARTVNDTLVGEARQWIDSLVDSGGCNLLKALKHAYTLNGLHTICVIVGSLPDQNMNILYHFIEQLALSKSVRLYIVSFECPHHQANATFKKLAELTDGGFHCYSSTEEDRIYSSTEIALLLDEVRACQEVLNRITQMKLGYLGTALVSIADQIKKHVANLPPSRFFPRPVGHDQPLKLEMPSFSPTTSADWLSKHGLKGKGLDLYQVLAPNAYSYLEEFIPVIRKTVQSQKQLGAVVKVYEKRIDWLSCGSRRLFGSVTENNIIIMIDASSFNANHIVHIQNTLRHVFQEQMCNKQYLNIIAFGSEIKMWKPSMVKVTGEILQEAWKWVLELHCSGGRNVLGALRRALECDDLASTVDVEGIYLMTSGVPDQPADVCHSYVEESAAGRFARLHVILFNVDDSEFLTATADPEAGSVLPCRYASITQTAEVLRQLAHSTPGGRFHWYRETGVIESDDLSLLTLEIEKAINFSQKCQMLVDSVKRKDASELDNADLEDEADPQNSTLQQTSSKPFPPPRDTALSQARKEIAVDKDRENAVPKALAYKDGQMYKQRRPVSASGPDSTSRVKQSKGPKVEQAFFYTGNKNDVGAVYKQYQTKPIASGGKAIVAVTIPEKEDQVTTKQWLRKYSLSKLRLSLNKLALGSSRSHVIGHATEHVSIINRTVEAKSCNVFPTVNVGGTLRHLLLTPVQLVEYQQQIHYVLTRYLHRMQWLLAGSRRSFGTVVEKTCVFLVDTSGSLGQYMEELKKELVSLVWEQLHKHRIKFNLVAFSRTCVSWRSNVVEPTEDNCHDAVRWISALAADGNTCTLEALKMAFDQYRDIPEKTDGGLGIYLLTDGKPDTSMSMVLNEVRRMNASKPPIVINTISFNCSDSMANEFLKTLASENGGRYHCVVQQHASDGGFDVHRFAHQLIETNFENPESPKLPPLSGDDVVRLAQEIEKGRKFIAQARTYLEMYEDLKKAQPASHDCFTIGPSSKQRPQSSKQ